MNLGARQTLMGDVVPYDSRVEYLENTGLQYIKTGIIPTDSMTFELIFNSSSRTSNWSVFFGSTIADNSPNSVLLRYYDTYNTTLNAWFGQSVYQNPQFSTTNGVKNTVKLCYGKCIYNNVQHAIASNSLVNPAEIFLFAGNYPNDGGMWRSQHFKCYEFNVYDNEKSIMRLIPVRIENVGYMYDKVSKQLFGNQGTGNFVLGPDI